MIKAIRGTRDLLPPDTALWDFVENTVRQVFAVYNFHEIRTPIFEATELFARGVGEETDIVSKEMFTWEDRGRAESEKNQSLTLRPENTAGVVRAYIEHNLQQRGLNKLYYIGPQFRRERPQKGRYRQFYQIGAEVIGPASSGSESPVRDAELLEMLAALLDRLGIQGWTLQLNSIGCAADRVRYNEALRQALEPVKNKMCADCQRRAVSNPLRVFDCKVPEDQPIIETLPRIGQFLDEPCRKHFGQVREILSSAGVPFTLNDRLVRGLDYYTRTAFEVYPAGAEGQQSAIGGGGRYDGLVELLGGRPTPGIGFGIGLDRVLLALDAAGRAAASDEGAPVAVVVGSDPADTVTRLRIATELRAAGLASRAELGARKLGKQLEAAARDGAHFAVIVGDELAGGQVQLRDLEAGTQRAIPAASLARELERASRTHRHGLDAAAGERGAAGGERGAAGS